MEMPRCKDLGLKRWAGASRIPASLSGIGVFGLHIIMPEAEGRRRTDVEDEGSRPDEAND